mmetsp:Transcript_2384/g.7172  ORF Transcript_2384/g.7172 Transcript_2384/m.7172 type:complete len:397 (-) Transcript_2384:557-1747(-)
MQCAADRTLQSRPGPNQPCQATPNFCTSLRIPRHHRPLLNSLASNRAARATTCGATGRQLRGCRLTGSGSSTPEAVLTNTDLEALVETNDEWIATRTGIRRRHVMAAGETLTSHAAAAATAALDMAGVSAEDVDIVMLSTSTPDDLFGSACQVQQIIGAKKAVAFDLTAACSGFVVGLVTAAQYIRTGAADTVLVIGADALSRYVDWRDRGTCILFGDGCGAVLVQAAAEGDSDSLLGHKMASDGAGLRHLKAPFQGVAGDSVKALGQGEVPSQVGSYANIFMNGGEVFKFAVRAVPTVVSAALKDADLEVGAVDWLLLHQANQRILDSASQRLGVPPERVISNLAEYGNTSAASIPLALDEAVRAGSVKDGDTIAIAGFGAGLTWASAIVKWGKH